MKTFKNHRQSLLISHSFNLYHLSTFLLFSLLFLYTPFASLTCFAQTFPSGFSQVQVASNISNPTVLAFAPDGRIFLAEQGGRLRVIKNGALLATPFVQLSVNSSGERGLIGIALDPNFASNQYIYLYYTVPTGTIHNRVSRFTANGDVALAGSETIILELDPLSSATNHNGGAMQFGKDGKLYVAIGDNANRANAQNLDTYHGKVIRINPDGSVPAGNPYVSGSEQRKRVWSYGLRNPYTFAFQPGTGRLFVNDVGEVTWEEINDATAGGANFGWPAAEGNSTNTAYKNPVYTYQHGSGDNRGCAITGGVFFNPATSTYPSSYTGKYFYQDLCNNWINFIDVSGTTAVRSPFAIGLPGQSLSISLGTDGNLYYLSRSNRALYKIIYTNINAPAITSHPGSLTVSQGQPATFTVSASGAAPLSYQWQKNGVNITGATTATYTIASTTSASAGQYRAIVSNAAGSVTSNAATLTVTAFNAAPTAKITSPANHTLYRAGTLISFTGTGTDPEDGTLPASAFTWTVDFHHDTHTHDGPPVADGSTSGSFTIPNQGETSANVWYRLFLTVTDSQGLTHRDSIDLDPRVVTISLATNPASLQLTLDNQAKSTPYSQPFVSGMSIPLAAPSPQTLNGVTYQFSNWSSGTVSGGNIIVPDVNTTYTANFSANAGQVLSSFTLINADTDQPITGYDPIATGATLNLATLPTRNLNIRANTSPATVGSVRFTYDGANYRTESAVPYCIGGDQGNFDYLPWTPATGNHTLTGTPYTGSGASGTAGTAKTITFNVVNSSATYLSDLNWTSATNGWGPVEKDKSNGENSAASDGKVITLNGVTYTKGLGVHSLSTLVYNLAGNYNQFISDMGIDDEVGNNGLVNFQVYLDNVLAYESGNMSGSSATKSVTLNITGKNQLRLVVTDGGNGLSYDHANWAGARVITGSGSTLAQKTSELNSKEAFISVYPNPSVDYLMINVSSDIENEANIYFTDALSRRAKTITTPLQAGENNIRLLVGDLPKGVYLLTVEEGNQRTTKKIIIEK